MKGHMDDISSETLKLAANGDMVAFEQIYKAYASFVYNVAYRMVEAKEDAEEVTQEVFVIVYQKLKSFMFRSSLKTWIYRITSNCAINLLNKRTRDTKGKVDIEDVIGVVSSAPEMRHFIEHEDANFKVGILLQQLNPDEKACIVLRNIEGLSYEEIAKSLKININTVRTRLKRGREKMLKFKEEVVNGQL